MEALAEDELARALAEDELARVLSELSLQDLMRFSRTSSENRARVMRDMPTLREDVRITCPSQLDAAFRFAAGALRRLRIRMNAPFEPIELDSSLPQLALCPPGSVVVAFEVDDVSAWDVQVPRRNLPGGRNRSQFYLGDQDVQPYADVFGPFLRSTHVARVEVDCFVLKPDDFHHQALRHAIFTQRNLRFTGKLVVKANLRAAEARCLAEQPIRELEVYEGVKNVALLLAETRARSVRIGCASDPSRDKQDKDQQEEMARAIGKNAAIRQLRCHHWHTDALATAILAWPHSYGDGIDVRMNGRPDPALARALASPDLRVGGTLALHLETDAAMEQAISTCIWQNPGVRTLHLKFLRAPPIDAAGLLRLPEHVKHVDIMLCASFSANDVRYKCNLNAGNDGWLWAALAGASMPGVRTLTLHQHAAITKRDASAYREAGAALRLGAPQLRELRIVIMYDYKWVEPLRAELSDDVTLHADITNVNPMPFASTN